jgi:excisionase family DNA binding protein
MEDKNLQKALEVIVEHVENVIDRAVRESMDNYFIEKAKSYENEQKEDVYLNIKQISEYTGFSVHTIYKYVANRKIPHIRLDRKILFSKNEIEGWLKGLRK